MTSYSPSVLALNDLLRQQLQLTQQFVTNTRRLHEFYVNSLQADHSYTTLQDTLQVGLGSSLTPLFWSGIFCPNY